MTGPPKVCQPCKQDIENVVHGHLSMSVVPESECEMTMHHRLNEIARYVKTVDVTSHVLLVAGGRTE